MEKTTAILAALADPIRLRALALIHGVGELCVCELVTALDVAQPKVSRHLAVLREAGILVDRRDAQWVLYALSDALDGQSREIVAATVGAVAGEPQIVEDLGRLERTSRPVRIRAGCRRPAGEFERLS